MNQLLLPLSILLIALSGCNSTHDYGTGNPEGTHLFIRYDSLEESMSIYREQATSPIITQVAKSNFRPYLHPIVAPDGKGLLTEYSPGHHKHQTGLYWGFTRVNERDYFHHPEGEYWKKVSANIVTDTGKTVQWQTIYVLLDEAGNGVLEETQKWSMKEENGRYILDLEWQGKALVDVTIGKYDYGGLFLRMPWTEGIKGEVVNAARQRNEKAEGKRAIWVDAGMQVEGREDLAHVTIFDHPENKGFPQYWRVDGQLGIGPAKARKEDWYIKKGEAEIIKHQVVMHTGELNNVDITELWKAFSGHGDTWALWGVAQQEGLEAEFLTPEKAVENMTIKEGFKVNAWAAEPMMTQPMAFCWDDKGRIWIAENRDYESRDDGFSNSGDSRIVILEDTDHDGVADSRKVFLDGIAFPAAIAVGFDGLFLGAPPNLLFVPDKNKDDIADKEDIEVLLTGWGISDRHETINSLHWGPDGWLYGCEGFATPSKVGKPKGKGKLYGHKDSFPEDILEGDGTDINGGVWRYHPTKQRFEVVAHGFSNPWGIDYDAKGQLFISACVIPHMWHIIPGGIYHRQGGQHFNPYVYSDIKTIADHRHRSAHGGARVYLSDAFPQEQYGRIFMANIHEHAVLSDILTPKGSGFTATHGDDFMMANNAQWIGFSMEIGPEGGLYVLDWHDADICGKEVFNKNTGRIFRITPENSRAENWEGRYEDLQKMSDEVLASLQTSASDWHARRARLILQYRATKGPINNKAISQLNSLYHNHTNVDFRLRAMWGLHVTGNLDNVQLEKALDDKNEYVRAWAIQLLCEDLTPPPSAINKFAEMAQRDKSPVVRVYLAAALQRVQPKDVWKIAEGLITRKEDVEDHNIPKMIWYGIEPTIQDNLTVALEKIKLSNLPFITQNIARRAVDANAMEQLAASLVKIPDPQLSEALKGTRDGLAGNPDIKAPSNWPAVYKALQEKQEVKNIALEIAQFFGDSEAAEKLLNTLKNKNAPLADRQLAIKALAEKQRKELATELPALLEEPALRLYAIRATASYELAHLGSILLQQYPRYNSNEKSEAIQTLSSRSRYGRMLTNAIKTGDIPRRDIPAYIARQLRRVVGNGFVEVWGPIDPLSDNIASSFAKYEAFLTKEAIARADAKNGKTIFSQTCLACHTMYGEGGNLGPDITGSNRTNLTYLLSNILDPSGEIQDDYKMTIITTRDGRTYMGSIASEDDRQVTLRTVAKDDVVIGMQSIQSREESPLSIMPQGLIENLSEKEVLDLVKYLQSDGNI